VTINVTDQTSTASDDSFTVSHDQTLLSANVLANDNIATSNAVLPIIVTGPVHGTVTVNDDGTVNYTPSSGYVGADSFTYKVNDGLADSNTATVSLTVDNSPAHANDVTVNTLRDQPLDLG